MNNTLRLERRRTPRREWTFRDPVYDVSICLVHGTPETLQRYLCRTFDVDAPPLPDRPGRAATRLVSSPRGTAVVIWLSESLDLESNDGISVLAHEAQHAAYEVLNAAGCAPAPQSNEAYAHYKRWILCECLGRLRGNR